jgi:hypothetical protein
LEKSYYRLKLIDLDNSVEYSSILFLEQELSEDFAIYPNPVNNTLNLRFDAQNSSTVQIRIFNTLGQLVLENFQDVKFGINTFSLPLDVLSSGEYYLQLSLSNKSSVLKFTKK